MLLLMPRTVVILAMLLVPVKRQIVLLKINLMAGTERGMIAMRRGFASSHTIVKRV